ncbi:glycosyltransferase [Williamsia sp. MIQD14]|uniref:glycosyltransferase n=1 Tax=Williamsia sp. MIQD14 TaxID=3425703 RepID=UPI003DA123B2
MTGPGVFRCADGTVVVADNRWDLVSDERWGLVADETAPARSISVVIPYYEQPAQLHRVLTALDTQTVGTDRIEVIVADDGSAQPPDVRGHTVDVTVVRQADNGFRAAAARNLGARTSNGELLCFLDADTVPEPDYLAHAIALPSVVPDALVVGRRRHADFSTTPATELTEPQWLVDAYGWTENLLRPGWTGYRYVISAVMTCSRVLFDEVGGFDESFTRYGGEDWELANRMTMAGAVLAHEPRAVAWHDGPDWAARDTARRTDAKNGEALSLAPRITEPAARTAGLRYEVPDVVARVSTAGHTPASLHRTIASIVRTGDVAVWLVGDNGADMHDVLALHDSRIRRGAPGRYVLDRCRFVADVAGRVVFGDTTLEALTTPLGPGGAGGIDVDFGDTGAVTRVTTTRALRRAERHAARLGMTQDEAVAALFGHIDVAADDVQAAVVREEPWLSW